MTPEQLDAAATIQAIAEELRDTDTAELKRRVRREGGAQALASRQRRQGRRILAALDSLTGGTDCPDPLASDASEC